ncbi:MAG TPA: pseudouridine synthase [Candidatus Paceibacterota bacterium]|nr:pseudouridine synthase [Candidatus Paceibacterota bacterium]
MKISYPIRINRYLALNNYATRVGADELIKKGLVIINGHKAILGDKVEENDKVEVSNKALKNNYAYYAYNKAIGVSTNKELGCKDILSVTKFPRPLPSPPLGRGRENYVFPVGRLDKDSHGLILMTNDGRVTDRLLSPKYVHEKEYVVKVEPNFSDKFIKLMGSGVHFDGFISKKCKVWPARHVSQGDAGGPANKSTNTFHIILTEGKKRQIRRMCEALHHKVIDLKRIRIMNIELGKLPISEYREIEGKELDELLRSLQLR